MSYRPDLNPAAGDWVAPEKANTALNRYGTVDEVVALVEFVVSPEAAYVTGANLTVDGGTNAYVNSRTVMSDHWGGGCSTWLISIKQNQAAVLPTDRRRRQHCRRCDHTITTH